MLLLEPIGSGEPVCPLIHNAVDLVGMLQSCLAHMLPCLLVVMVVLACWTIDGPDAGSIHWKMHRHSCGA